MRYILHGVERNTPWAMSFTRRWESACPIKRGVFYGEITIFARGSVSSRRRGFSRVS